MGMSDDDVKIHDALKKLEQGLKNIKPARVLLVGDIMMDCYIHGFANNLNSVHRFQSSKKFHVMSMWEPQHVARGLDSLGLKSHLHGVVGDDDSGLAILEMLEEEGVETSGIAVLEERTTTVKTRLLGSTRGSGQRRTTSASMGY